MSILFIELLGADQAHCVAQKTAHGSWAGEGDGESQDWLTGAVDITRWLNISGEPIFRKNFSAKMHQRGTRDNLSVFEEQGKRVLNWSTRHRKYAGRQVTGRQYEEEEQGKTGSDVPLVLKYLFEQKNQGQEEKSHRNRKWTILGTGSTKHRTVLSGLE